MAYVTAHCVLDRRGGGRPACGFRDSLETRQNLSSLVHVDGCVNKASQICKVTVMLGKIMNQGNL